VSLQPEKWRPKPSQAQVENPCMTLVLSAKTEQKRVEKSGDEILNGKIK
jgi:hypothetical protein